MSDFNIGDKVFLECEVTDIDRSDNTYRLAFEDFSDEESTIGWVDKEVLHPVNESYNRGLNDSWELAKKIVLPDHLGGYTVDELKDIFGKNTFISLVNTFTPQEALAKAKTYEERNEIKVGDVIRLKRNTHEAIVTRANEINICYLFRDGNCGWFHVEKDFEKIGHFDSIDEFMRSKDD